MILSPSDIKRIHFKSNIIPISVIKNLRTKKKNDLEFEKKFVEKGTH